MDKKDKRINLIYVQFDLESFKRVDRKLLTKTAQDFFHTLNEFAKVHKRKVVNVYMVDDQLQDSKSDTCGLFQLYFYTNLFLPKENSKILGSKTLNMKTLETLLNE